MKVYELTKSAVDYALKGWKLNKVLTNVSANKIKDFLKEANVVKNELARFLNSQNIQQQLIRGLDTSIVYTIVRALRPEIVVETGVSNGISTYFILKALEQNKKGLLYSIDLPPEISTASIPYGKEIGWLVSKELRHRWRLLLGDAKEMLPKLLSELHEIDVFLHDSDHSYKHMTFEFRTAWKHLRSAGFLFIS